MNLTFKKAEKVDIEIVARLAERIWRKHYIDIITREQIEYMLKKMYSHEQLIKQMEEGHVFSLAHLDDIPVGYISVSTKDQKNYFLHKFYVEVKEQAKGIGSRFFQYILEELGDAESIELTVNRSNFKAINFYFKNGFVIKEVADFDIGDGFFMNDFVMIKRLK
jgi:diamine N-acetyltransferase